MEDVYQKIQIIVNQTEPLATPAVNGAVGGYDASRNIGKPTPQTFYGRIIKDGKFKLKGLGNKLTVLDVGVSGAMHIITQNQLILDLVRL